MVAAGYQIQIQAGIPATISFGDFGSVRECGLFRKFRI